MTADESVRLLEQLLAQVPADPVGVWEAFREWARHPVACERDELEASLGYDAGTAWIEFRRVLEDPGAADGADVVLRFSTSRPNAPRVAPTGERCEDPGGLAEFFARVEELPGFQLALTYPYWEFEAQRS
jgi:hypothetical protein